MTGEEYLPVVREIMMKFAALTGLSPVKKHPRRYLWTDAFAVCNFLELYCETGDEQYRDLAARLVNQVHSVLGKHREDDARRGWISGLSEEEGKQHPTEGGLRIGKKLNERKPGEPYNDRLEWDQDGQYFHYLTKWMHALNQMCGATGDFVYNRWAIELAKTAHSGFVYTPPISGGGQKRMYWKMSIDLSDPLVPSMGQHDPLDGLVTYCRLQATGKRDPIRQTSPDLIAEIADMTDMCAEQNWITDDSLGIGGLLSDAYTIAQLISSDDFERPGLLETLLESSLEGLRVYTRDYPLRLPARYRLPFRELGLSIGLGATEKIKKGSIGQKEDHRIRESRLESLVGSLMSYVPLRETIQAFWLQKANQQSEGWKDHLDINMVMLATSLAPDGYLNL
jgi:hypothetical protein